MATDRRMFKELSRQSVKKADVEPLDFKRLDVSNGLKLCGQHRLFRFRVNVVNLSLI